VFVDEIYQLFSIPNLSPILHKYWAILEQSMTVTNLNAILGVVRHPDYDENTLLTAIPALDWTKWATARSQANFQIVFLRGGLNPGALVCRDIWKKHGK
jgi:hypothetical protein